SYNFDKVYGEEASTQDVYEDIVKEIVSSVCHQGRNGTVFSYGQTSTGKTYTMHGIICSAARDIFQNVEDREESGKKESQSLTIVKVACMELYNEELRDLLVNNGNSSSSPALSIKEDRKGNVQIPNLTEQRVSSVDDLLTVIHAADMNRSVGATAMNQRSSRSHTIFRITYEKKEAKATHACSAGKVVTTVSTLNLVDLAGSESVRLTNASGVRQKEGGKINQSLLTLSTVLVKLGKKDSGHINYRDSKLTRILKPSLSGNARMSAICCISPACQYSEESKSTLDFASRAMLVRTNAKTNETIEYDDALVGEFEKEIERFKAETANAEESKRKLYMMQVEELTLRNEELKEMKKQESAESSESNEKLLKTINDLTVQNEELQKKMKVVSEEKAQLEWRLMREQKKAQRRKEEALEKRRTFKSKLTSMTGRLKEDMKHVELSSQAN
ncbi:kinesin motor protein-like protein, partial [Thalassiosira pseudonana CCMP1335]